MIVVVVLRAYYVPGAVLSPRDSIGNKTRALYLGNLYSCEQHELTFLKKKTTKKPDHFG